MPTRRLPGPSQSPGTGRLRLLPSSGPTYSSGNASCWQGSPRMPCPRGPRPYGMSSRTAACHPFDGFTIPTTGDVPPKLAIPGGSPDAAGLRGAARIRTGDRGFAVLCLTTWPRRLEGWNGAKSGDCCHDVKEAPTAEEPSTPVPVVSFEPSSNGPALAEPSTCPIPAGRPSSKLRFQALRADYTPLTTAPRKSGKPDSNRRPPPWQGGALPTELFPRVRPRGARKRRLQGAGT